MGQLAIELGGEAVCVHPFERGACTLELDLCAVLLAERLQRTGKRKPGLAEVGQELLLLEQPDRLLEARDGRGVLAERRGDDSLGDQEGGTGIEV